MAAALNRFISKSSDKCHAFFHALKGKSRRSFEWTPECDTALAELKGYLSSAPLMVKPKEFETLYLYHAVSIHVVSSALVQQEGAGDMPIYCTSKTLLPTQTCYLPLEKLALALVSVVLADFIAELTPKDTKTLNTPPPLQPVAEQNSAPKPWHLFQGDIWCLHVDGASNSNGAGAGVMLVSPFGTLHESSISIDFPATNNEAEYEVLLAGLRSAIALKAVDLVVYCDSELIVNQVLGDYEARDPKMLKYQATVAELITHFENFKIEQINREHNAHADALAGLASAAEASKFRTINFDSIDHPSSDTNREVLNVELGPSWTDEIVAFLKHDTLPSDKKEAYRIRNKAAYYWLSENDQLYRKSISGPYDLVVHPTQVLEILTELHSGSCGCHSSSRSFCQRAMSQGYFWKNMKKDCEEVVHKC
ncbi:uncharacterized protein LOC131299707 [Rhododendron vialii]|uniref:uncharacterized protein LOC131299707 n=1 Tax=Rhododendron vialii TaxID=182163 RepID=UPI00265E8C11|nr:uncharacterized protein LOC131299707 [Rhododendron vialii]